MTWALAFVICFGMFLFGALGFLLFVYMKEFKREEVLLKQAIDNQMKRYNQNLVPVVLVDAPAKRKKIVTEEAPKKKENIN